MNEPCLCGALDCRACRGSDAYDPDIAADDDQRADYTMRADRDPLADSLHEHIYFTREAAAGGRGVGGGGCGCNIDR